MIEVYSGERLFGYLNVRFQPDMMKTSFYQIAVQNEHSIMHSDKEDLLPSIRTISLPIGIHSKIIDRIQLEQARYSGDMGVPDYAETSENVMERSFTYRWPVFLVKEDMKEEIFDLDIFTPADTERDPEASLDDPILQTMHMKSWI